jgi:hypothetical protein
MERFWKNAVLPEDLKISDKARTILLAADADINHSVLHMSPGLQGGWSFETCEQKIASGTDSSLHSLWEEALLELIDHGLLEKSFDDLPQLYKITGRGHQVAQILRAKSSGFDPQSPA